MLATALIYSISELIVSSYLDQNMEPDIKEIVKKLDYKKEIEKIKREKTNEQLNQMSNLYFNKINSTI